MTMNKNPDGFNELKDTLLLFGDDIGCDIEYDGDDQTLVSVYEANSPVYRVLDGITRVDTDAFSNIEVSCVIIPTSVKHICVGAIKAISAILFENEDSDTSDEKDLIVENGAIFVAVNDEYPIFRVPERAKLFGTQTYLNFCQFEEAVFIGNSTLTEIGYEVTSIFSVIDMHLNKNTWLDTRIDTGKVRKIIVSKDTLDKTEKQTIDYFKRVVRLEVYE